MMGAIQSGKLVVLKDGGTRQFRSKQERRAIVEETLKPGASVALVARAHDVNANQVFKWRRQYRDGQLENAAASNALLPVKVCDTASKVGLPVTRRQGKGRRAGVIDIDLGHARVRIEGSADPDCVRAALERLIR
jgi:transposase